MALAHASSLGPVFTRLGVFLTVLGTGIPMGLGLATGLWAPWLERSGATVDSIGQQWRWVLLTAGALLLVGIALTMAGQLLRADRRAR